MPNPPNAAALGHIRIVELGDITASYATRALADLGADVVKVEPPGGDPSRLLPPFACDIEDPERSLTFINANTNKRGIVLDLQSREADRAIFGKLLAASDLFIEAAQHRRDRGRSMGQDHASRPARNPVAFTGERGASGSLDRRPQRSSIRPDPRFEQRGNRAFDKSGRYQVITHDIFPLAF